VVRVSVNQRDAVRGRLAQFANAGKPAEASTDNDHMLFLVRFTPSRCHARIVPTGM